MESKKDKIEDLEPKIEELSKTFKECKINKE